jgi:hypothetical protein
MNYVSVRIDLDKVSDNEQSIDLLIRSASQHCACAASGDPEIDPDLEPVGER